MKRINLIFGKQDILVMKNSERFFLLSIDLYPLQVHNYPCHHWVERLP